MPGPVSASAGRGSAVRVAVVGTGIAGLAAATWARDLGHEVVVFEATDRPGGRACGRARP
ncbi:MAG: FAD-dependent oxidoreductase, partial [Pseudomonadota bacterium]